jgi:hypothetical protein
MYLFFFFNFIIQHVVYFELVYIICFDLFSMRLSQFQTYIPVFDQCSILLAFIFTIILLSKKKVLKKQSCYDLGR